MESLEILIDSYFSFHYGVGFAIGFVFFCGYIFLISRRKKSRGQSVSKKDILWGLALSIYMIFLLGGTILNREIGEEYTIKWIPFWSYYDLLSEWNKYLAIQIVHNILVFIPYGFLVSEIVCVSRKMRMVILSALGLSFSIEVIQFVFRLGLFEFDDIFHNVLGAMSGGALWRKWQYSGVKKSILCHINAKKKKSVQIK